MANLYQPARFLLSVPDSARAPPDVGREAAFAGRSNAGKSSALNLITRQKALARTSKTPGRTRHLVFFALDAERRLVDLPGYGYAKAPQQLRRQWQGALERYLTTRRSLQGLVLVMDVRHPLTDFDRQMVAWCHQAQLPAHVLLTKADKLSRGRAAQTLAQVRKDLANGPWPVSVQLFSALARTGAEQAHTVLDRWLGQPPDDPPL